MTREFHREIDFVVPGVVAGKGRPRLTRTGHAFTPKKTRSAEAMVRHLAAIAMRGKKIMEGPVELRVSIWLLIPKSWAKKKRDASFWASGRPDVDNIVKLIADAMNKIVYRDDAQIAALMVERRYSLDRECTVVNVLTLTADG